jgi:uncharacterized protein YbjT (DUF2867 family)
MITVMGATGQVGRQITERLLEAGESVRAIGRNPRTLAALAAAGAETFCGDAADVAFLTRAFRGAVAVHTLLPYDPTTPDFRAEQKRLGEAIVTAVRDTGVRHVVALSSLGADLPVGTGFIASLHAQEQRLRRLTDVNVLILRPGLFFESITAAVDLVRALGINADAVAADAPVPMIATRDVAEVAAAALAAHEWTGVQVRELLGPSDLTYTEATSILGAAIGRPDLEYVRLPDAEMVEALVQAGFSPDTAVLHVEMGRALSDGTIVSLAGRTEATATPTPFEAVVADLVQDRAA